MLQPPTMFALALPQGTPRVRDEPPCRVPARGTHQLEELYDNIADAGSSETAARYTDAVVTYGDGLSHFPHLGTVRAGNRTLDAGRLSVYLDQNH